jgi:sugar phosphate isomerase/epimerase
VLGKHVVSVHAKDGDWPPAGKPGALGEEKALGKGAVGIERFIGKLKEIGYKGTLNVEREIPDATQRLLDIRDAVQWLERIR